jgi:hypothetical protein
MDTFEKKQDFLNNLSKVIDSVTSEYPKIQNNYLNGLSDDYKERLKEDTRQIEYCSGLIAKTFPKKIQDAVKKLPDETRDLGNVAAYNGVRNYLQAYEDLKTSSDSDSDSLGIKKAFEPLGKAVNGVVKGAILFGVIFLFSLLVLITLVLLLLSIERNTRKETA